VRSFLGKEIHVESEPSRTGRFSWPRWILGNTAGAALGLFVGIGAGGFVIPLFVRLFFSDALPLEAAPWIIPVVFGAAMGISQSLVLRQQVPPWGWLWCTAIGWGVVLIKMDPFLVGSTYLVGPMGAGIKAAVIGAATGVVQWLILRKQSARAGWWVPASAVGWAMWWMAFTVAPDPVSEIMEATVFGNLEKGGGSMTREGVRLLFFGLPISAALGGLAYSIVTGAALTRILGHTGHFLRAPMGEEGDGEG
jgi:hypothetical protein